MGESRGRRRNRGPKPKDLRQDYEAIHWDHGPQGARRDRKDENGFYAWCPELKGCQSQGDSLEEAITNIREAIELYLETLPNDERDGLRSREILTTTVEVNA